MDVDKKAVKICTTNLHRATITCENSLHQDYTQWDIIVTNPPYVRIQNLSTQQKQEIKDAYEFCIGDTDLYMAFFEKLAKCEKIVGMICPNSWMRNKSAHPLRKYLFDKRRISEMIDFRGVHVFPTVQTYTCIVIFSPSEELLYSTTINDTLQTLSYEGSSSDALFVGKQQPTSGNAGLLDYCDIKIGLATLCDKIYFGEVVQETEKENLCLFKTKERLFLIERNILKKCVKASKISQVKDNTYIIFPYDENNQLLDENYIRVFYPLAYNYLVFHKNRLLARDKGKIPLEKWFGFGRTQGLSNNKEKLLIPPFHKDELKVRYSSADELYISGYAAVPKPGYDITTVRTYFENKDLFTWIKTNGKTMANGWFGLSKEILKNYKFHLKGDNNESSDPKNPI
jgi:hypothetical protein